MTLLTKHSVAPFVIFMWLAVPALGAGGSPAARSAAPDQGRLTLQQFILLTLERGEDIERQFFSPTLTEHPVKRLTYNTPGAPAAKPGAAPSAQEPMHAVYVFYKKAADRKPELIGLRWLINNNTPIGDSRDFVDMTSYYSSLKGGLLRADKESGTRGKAVFSNLDVKDPAVLEAFRRETKFLLEEVCTRPGYAGDCRRQGRLAARP